MSHLTHGTPGKRVSRPVLRAVGLPGDTSPVGLGSPHDARPVAFGGEC